MIALRVLALHDRLVGHTGRRRGREQAAYAFAAAVGMRLTHERTGASEHRRAPERARDILATDLLSVETALRASGHVRDDEHTAEGVERVCMQFEEEVEHADDLRRRLAEVSLDWSLVKSERDAADARAAAERARADRLHAALRDACLQLGALLAVHTVRREIDGRTVWRPQTITDARLTEVAAEHDRLGMVARDDAPPVGAETEGAKA